MFVDIGTKFVPVVQITLHIHEKRFNDNVKYLIEVESSDQTLYFAYFHTCLGLFE